MKKPKPMNTKDSRGRTGVICRGDVQPNMNSEVVKKREPTIIGGRRASGTGLLSFASKRRM